MGHFEDEYFLLYPADVKIYPMIYEDCHRLTCSYDKYKDCDKTPDCPAIFKKKVKIDNPKPFIMDFSPDNEKPVVYADFYIPFSLSNSSFVVSPKIYNILNSLNIEGVQFIPVTLMENNKPKYTDFWYVHVFNYLDVLSKKSVYQIVNGVKISNNIVQIKFSTKKMSKIPLEKRLIFKLLKDRDYFLFHESVVEKLNGSVGVEFDQLTVNNEQ
jgi:hypothetical protein